MKKILIADDDPVMVKIFELNLRKAGFHLMICREGLSVMARAKGEHPDIAIFDLMLPGMSGQELIRDFKSDSELKDIPIIVVTGQGKDSTRDSLISDGADSVFTKPFSPSALINRLNELL